MGAYIDIRLSPSRVEKYYECAARWGYSELMGLLEPGTEATELGTIVHDLRDVYYRTGKPFDLGTRGGWLAAAMSPVLPATLPPGGATELELRYPVMYRGRTFELVGRLDLCYPGVSQQLRPLAVVRDYKTTASMHYAKLEREALLGHSQAPLYGLMWALALDVQQTWLGWVYVGTRTSLGLPPWPEPELQPSDHVVTRDECVERVHLRMVPAAYAMLELRDAYAAGMSVDDFPKNLTSCWKYNKRCPHWARCRPEEQQKMSSAFLAAVGANVAAQTQTTTPAQQPATGTLFGPGTQHSTDAQRAALTAPAAGTTPPAGASVGADASAQTPINPPEGAGERAESKKGKGKAAAAGLTDADIDRIATAVVQKLGLKLVRDEAMPVG